MLTRTRGTLFAMAAALAVACSTNKPAEGPAERAGQKVDNAAASTKEAGKDAVDATKETASDAKHNIEKKTDKDKKADDKKW